MAALLLRSPALDDEATAAGDVEFEDMVGGAVHVPGLPPVPASCLPSGLVDRKVPTYRWFLYNGRRYTEAAGIIVNTVAELEPRVLAAIADGRCTRGDRAPTVYAVGPVLAATTTPPPADAEQQQEEHECVRWLDSQPPASVLFLCFGSIIIQLLYMELFIIIQLLYIELFLQHFHVSFSLQINKDLGC
jgi:hypothetical protein